MPKPKTVKELVYQLSEEPGFTDLTDDEQYSIIDRASSELGLKATSPEPPTKHPVEQAFESEQQAKAMAAQQQQAAIAQQQQVDRDPKNWSPERLDAEIKANPPKTMQEAASVEMLRLQKENEIEMLKTQDKQAKEQAASAQKAQAALQKVTQTHFVQQSKSLLKDLLKGIEAPIAGMPQQVGSLIKEQGTAIKEPLLNPSAPKDLMEETNWPDPGDLVKLFRASIKKTGAGQKLEDYGQKLIDDNKKYLEQHAAQYTPEQNALNQFVYQFGSGTTSIAAAIGLSLATRSPAAASIAFGAYQKAQVYQEATEAGEAPEQARTRSNMAGIVEGALESVGLKWFFGAKAFRRVSPHVVRSAIEAGQEIAQQSGEEAIMSDIRKSGFADVSKRIALAGSIGGLLGGGSSAVLSTVQQQGLVKRLEALGFSKDVSEKIAKAEIDAALREENGQLQKLVESGEIDKSIDTLQPVSQELTTPESTKKPIYPQEQEAVSAPKAEVPIVQREQEPAAAPEAGPAQVPSAPQAETVQPQSLPGEVPPPPIAYEDFKKEYVSNFNSLMKYRPDQVGSQVFAEKMAKMSDEHPDWVERIENEGAVSAPTEAVQAAPPAQPAEVVQEQPKPIEPIQEQQKEAIVSELQLPTDPFLLRARAAKLRADFKVADEKLRTAAKSNEALLKLHEQLVDQGRSTRSVEERLAAGIQKLEDSANKWRALDQERIAIAQRLPSVTREKLLASEGTMKLEEVQKIAERARTIGAKQAEKVAKAEQRTVLREEREKAEATLRESKKALREEKQQAVVSEREKQTALRRETVERHAQKHRASMKEQHAQLEAARVDLGNALKTKAGDIESRKQAVVNYANSVLPIEVPKFLINTVKNVKTDAQLSKAITQIDRVYVEGEKKRMIRLIRLRAKQALSAKNVDVEYQRRIRDILSGVDLKKRTKKTYAKAEKTRDWLNRAAMAGQEVTVTERIAKAVEMLEAKPLSEMSISNLAVLYDEISFVIHLGKVKIRMRKAVDQHLAEAALKESKTGLTPINPAEMITSEVGEGLRLDEKSRNLLRQASNIAQRVDIGYVPMNVVFEMMSKEKGYEGFMFKHFKNLVDIDDDIYLARRNELAGELRAIVEKHDLNRKQRVQAGLYAYSQMPGGMDYIRSSGVSEETVKAIKLSEGQMEYYRKVREIADSLHPAIANQLRLLFNKDLGYIENYVPVQADWRKQESMSVVPFDKEFDRLQRYPEHGFTEKRVGGLKNVDFDLQNIMERYIDDAVYFVTFAEDLKHMWDIARTDAFRESAGEIGQEVTLGWLDTLARNGGTGAQTWRGLDWLKRNSTAALLAFKLSSIAVQWTQLLDAASLIGGQWVFGGFFDVARSQDIRNWVRDNFPQLKERAGDDISMKEFSAEPTLQQVQKIGTKPLVAADWLAAAGSALGSYRKHLKAKGLDFDLNNIDPESVVAAERDVARTQSSQRFKDMSPAQGQGFITHNRSVDRTLTFLQSFIISRWGRLRYDIARMGIKGNKREAARQFAWILMGQIAESGIRLALSKGVLASFLAAALGLADWDKVEKEFDEAAKAYPKRAWLDLLGQVPFMAPLISTAVYDSQMFPVLEGPADFASGSLGIFTRKKIRTKIRSGLKALGGAGRIMGIPTEQAKQLLEEFFQEPEKTKSGGSRLMGTKLRGKR